jgi:ribosomal protein S18 acetylase RimI-like enzyme
MSQLQTRPYTPQDLPACLAIFDSNVPTYFAASERQEFQSDLQALTPQNGAYLVLVDDGDVIACGGLGLSPDRQSVSLDWGMVRADRRGMGLGTRLTESRLALARNLPGLVCLTLTTSQHTMGFYQGFGFTVASVIPGGFGPGLDRVDMVLPLA